MDKKDELLLALRPIITGIDLDSSTSEDELFQNKTLRPVIKAQHKLLVASFIEYLGQHKINMDQLGEKEKKGIIDNTYSKNKTFRSYNLGLIAGFLTQEELGYYLLNKSSISKRIIQMIKQRIDDTLG